MIYIFIISRTEFREQTERMNRRYLQFYKERNFDGIAAMYSKNCRFMPAGFPMQSGPDGEQLRRGTCGDVILSVVKCCRHCEVLGDGGRARFLLALVRDSRAERDVRRARDRALSLRVSRRERKRDADRKVSVSH